MSRLEADGIALGQPLGFQRQPQLRLSIRVRDVGFVSRGFIQ
jgi:hypothetical protein